MKTLVAVQREDLKVWPSFPDRSLGYWLFLVATQLDEIAHNPEKATNEFSDIFLIALHYLRSNTPSAADAVLTRLTSRHEGQTEAIKSKYDLLWEQQVGHPCATCGAGAGQLCINPFSNTMRITSHPVRIVVPPATQPILTKGGLWPQTRSK